MINKKIAISIVIVLFIGIGAAGYQISTKTPGLFQPINLQGQNPTGQGVNGGSGASTGQGVNGGSGTSTGQGQSTNGGNNVKVSYHQAKSIAQNFIEEPTANAGTPKLITLNGKSTYVVPVISNGKIVGEIYIDPETGENVGGAGGAP
jgi:Peptidase propeptide and YPEB domain